MKEDMRKNKRRWAAARGLKDRIRSRNFSKLFALELTN